MRDQKWKNGTDALVDKCLGRYFGTKGGLPVVRDWNGSGKVSIGVFPTEHRTKVPRHQWKREMGRVHMDACVGPFGHPGDWPVVGKKLICKGQFAVSD